VRWATSRGTGPKSGGGQTGPGCLHMPSQGRRRRRSPRVLEPGTFPSMNQSVGSQERFEDLGAEEVVVAAVGDWAAVKEAAAVGGQLDHRTATPGSGS
jgi:hypothetical protein